MQYSIILKQFAKRAQITFGAVAKGNLLPLECVDKSEEVRGTFNKLFLGCLARFELLVQY
jgi:hypothetical protein